jgi:hypothetical protein
LNFNNPIDLYLTEPNFLVFMFPFYGGISAGFFLLFIDYFENESISATHSCVYGAFLGAFVLNVLNQLVFSPSSGVEMTNQNLAIFKAIADFLLTTNFPASYFVIYVIVISYRALSRIKSLVINKDRKKQILYLQLTLFCYYFVTMILIVVSYQLETLFSPTMLVFIRHLAPHISIIIGGGLVYQSYVKAPVAFLQFQRMEKIMVITRSGLLLFSYDFDISNTETKRDEFDVLFSSGVFAVVSLFSEIMKTRDMQMIQFQDRKIMLAYTETLVVFLIVDRTSKFLWRALESFLTMFSLQYGLDNTELSVVPVSLFADAEKLLKLAFGGIE